MLCIGKSAPLFHDNIKASSDLCMKIVYSVTAKRTSKRNLMSFVVSQEGDRILCMMLLRTSI
jgi:hypothetical protein